MLFYRFRDYEGFKDLFEMRETNSGKDRRNKVLLSYVKQRELVHRAVCGDREDAYFRINLSSMSALYSVIMRDLYNESFGCHLWQLGSFAVFSTNLFKPDDYRGLCEDGDARAIRYVNVDNGRVFKMKSGKFLRKVMEEHGILAKLPEQVSTWVCEEFANRWQSYAMSQMPQAALVVDSNFRTIYNGESCEGNFHSCMTDRDNYAFYEVSVRAKAAYLQNSAGKIVARCVIFTEVHDDDTGEILRLAERQYSTDCNLVLQRCLIDKLIEAGEIDGYKTVGAGCSEAEAFVSNTGEDWSGRRFSIYCDLDYGDVLSYQDSFKWYDMDGGRAYNYYKDGADLDLSTTDGELEGRNWDSWHERWTENDTVTVHSQGYSYECDEEELDDFIYIRHDSGQWEYHHKGECAYCEDLDDYVLDRDAHYSGILDEFYYDEDRMEEAENEYKARHWAYSDYDEEFYEDEDDVVVLHRAEGDTMTISKESLDVNFSYEVREGEYYELIEVEAA